MTILQKVLAMGLTVENVGDLTQEDIDWLHELKNKASVLQNRIMLKHQKEEGLAA